MVTATGDKLRDAPTQKLRRIGATLFDAIVTAAFVLLLTLASGQFEVAGPYIDGTLVLRATLLVIASYVLLHGLALHQSSQTLGKKLFGLQIVANNKPAPLWRLMIRAGLLLSLAFIPVIGYSLQLLHLVDLVLFLLPGGLALHDRVSGTNVVRVV